MRVVFAFPGGGTKPYVSGLGGKFLLRQFNLDRIHYLIQFGPLTGYRKEEQGYMDLKMMVFGRSWSW
jgi:hypothetical protein